MSEGKEEVGVTIGLREIYNQTLEVSKSLTKLDSRMEKLEESFAVAPEADERSKNNKRELKQLREDFEEYVEDEEKKSDKNQQNIKWLIGIVVAFLTPTVPILIQYYLSLL